MVGQIPASAARLQHQHLALRRLWAGDTAATGTATPRAGDGGGGGGGGIKEGLLEQKEEKKHERDEKANAMTSTSDGSGSGSGSVSIRSRSSSLRRSLRMSRGYEAHPPPPTTATTTDDRKTGTAIYTVPRHAPPTVHLPLSSPAVSSSSIGQPRAAAFGRHFHLTAAAARYAAMLCSCLPACTVLHIKVPA